MNTWDFNAAFFAAQAANQARAKAYENQARSRENTANSNSSARPEQPKRKTPLPDLGVERKFMTAYHTPSKETHLLHRVGYGEWRPVLDGETGKPLVDDGKGRFVTVVADLSMVRWL